jgi:hypothetical protein
VAIRTGVCAVRLVRLAVPGSRAAAESSRTSYARRLDAAGDGVPVIGTTRLIGEGFDAPALDTLFLAGLISERAGDGKLRSTHNVRLGVDNDIGRFESVAGRPSIGADVLLLNLGEVSET